MYDFSGPFATGGSLSHVWCQAPFSTSSRIVDSFAESCDGHFANVVERRQEDAVVDKRLRRLQADRRRVRAPPPFTRLLAQACLHRVAHHVPIPADEVDVVGDPTCAIPAELRMA